jgi:hypothetical protein
MDLNLDRSIATAFFWMPMTEQWLELNSTPRLTDKLTAAGVDPDSAALVSAAEATLLWETHGIDPRAGVVGDASSDIAVRFPVRPDGIERSDVVLYEASGTAEVLARATLWPFYGIRSGQWLTEPGGDAQVTVVEGAEGLSPQESGFQEDLARAWFIMTNQPTVLYLLVLPLSWTAEQRDELVADLTNAQETGWERRRDVRSAVSAETGVASERLVEFYSRLRWSLLPEDIEAFKSMIYRGAGGSRYSSPDRLTIFGPVSSDEQAD